jgi:hypothetical protein
MQTTNEYDDEILSGTSAATNEPIVIAATFADRERAHDAVHRLHEEGFRDTWIGLTRRDEDEAGDGMVPSRETRVESENWFSRFFGASDESLHEALARHGVSTADMLPTGPLPPGNAIVTVNGYNHPEYAAEIVAASGGQLLTRGFGATGYGTPGALESTSFDQAPIPRTTSLLDDGTSRYPDPEFAAAADAVYDDYGRFRAGTDIDESTRLQLREERLRVDRSPLGETTIGTGIGAGTHAFDAPVIREELFIERRPTSKIT